MTPEQRARRNERQRAWRAANPERVQKYIAKEAATKTPEQKALRAEYQREYRSVHIDERRAYQRQYAKDLRKSSRNKIAEALAQELRTRRRIEALEDEGEEL